jgi:hypothetical protein
MFVHTRYFSHKPSAAWRAFANKACIADDCCMPCDAVCMLLLLQAGAAGVTVVATALAAAATAAAAPTS